MIWLVFAAMTAVALGGLLWPLMRARAVEPASSASVALYHAQIASIDRDTASGLVSASDAQAARTEAARRLIAEDHGADDAGATTTRRRTGAAALVVLSVAAAGLLYGRVGSPDQPDAPLSARAASTPGTDLAAALARIEAHLAREPDDARGWTVVAPVYLRLNRPEDAARAFAEIIRIEGPTPAREADLAEARVYAAQGVVTAEARRGFEAAAKADPSLPKARFYLGLAAEQDGDKARAKEVWTKLADETPPGSPLAANLRGRVAALDGPAPADAAAIATLAPGEQAQAIRGMVEGLASRLRENGDDIEGWLRLVRARRVLREDDRALAALADARRIFEGRPDKTARLDALARELGLER